MDQFVIRSNSKIVIASFANKRYLRVEANRRVSCSSCHPFMLQSVEEKSKCHFLLVPADDASTAANELNFCSSVYIVTEDGSYLTTNPNGDVFLESVETRGAGTNELDSRSMKFRKWTLTNRNQLISKKIIVTTDEVLIKSAFGNYMKVENGLAIANSSVIEDKTSFNFHQIGALPLPDWAVLRPFQSNLFMSSACTKLFLNNELFFYQTAYTGSKVKPELKFESVEAAQHVVMEETLYSLMSVDGYFIKRKYSPDNSCYYTFENAKEFELSFVQGVNRILPLASLHDKIRLFEELRGGINKGLIAQAFCSGLAEIRNEFYAVLNVVENELAAKQLDLQRFWLYLQTSFKIFGCLDKLLAALESGPDLQLLSVLYDFVATAIDEFV